VTYACNASIWETEQEDHDEFKASLGYIVRLYLEKQNKTKQNFLHLMNTCWALPGSIRYYAVPGASKDGEVT
jgi:hypothetical protein